MESARGRMRSMDAEQTQRELIEEFDLFDDWTDRYQYLIDLGRKLPEFPDAWRTEEHRLHGCQSQVWIHQERRGELLHFDAISDSAIVSGLIALLLRVYSDRPPEEIVTTEPDFVGAIGLDSHLSPTRKNGLHAMLQAIRGSAQAMLETRQA
jgi:cysteine desulfuration protein SufE